MVMGRIFDIQRFAIHDGPGIRTTVFLKGCPLRCLWCGNPESISPEPSLSYMPEKCIGCGACLDSCSQNALTTGDAGKVAVDRAQCTRCGDCAPHCDPQALEMVGRVATVDEVMAVVLKDKAYYDESAGGVTLSGGEPLMQPDFAAALLRQARKSGLHCCVETSGYAVWGSVRPLMQLVDLWLFDVKETDPRRHEQFVGKPNGMILANLKQLHAEGARILVRCPMIPQYNARTAFLDGLVALAHQLPRIVGVELLPYYDLWRGKLTRFGLTTELPASVKPPSAETVAGWKQYLRERGVTVVG